MLREQAYWVNQVWNYSNELAFKHFQRQRKFMSAYDLDKYTGGATKEGVPLLAQTIQAINAELTTRRRQFNKEKLGGVFQPEPEGPWAGCPSRRPP